MKLKLFAKNENAVPTECADWRTAAAGDGAVGLPNYWQIHALLRSAKQFSIQLPRRLVSYQRVTGNLRRQTAAAATNLLQLAAKLLQISRLKAAVVVVVVVVARFPVWLSFDGLLKPV